MRVAACNSEVALANPESCISSLQAVSVRKTIVFMSLCKEGMPFGAVSHVELDASVSSGQKCHLLLVTSLHSSWTFLLLQRQEDRSLWRLLTCHLQ